MSLFNKLRLLDLVKDSDVTTHLSHDPETGRRYLLHSLPVESDPSFASIKELLEKAPETSLQAILETGTNGGRTYLITEELPGFTSLEDLLRSQNSGENRADKTERPHRQTVPEFPIFSGTLAGEFTQLIRTAATHEATSIALPSKQRVGPEASSAGEFTRLIQPDKLEPAQPQPAHSPFAEQSHAEPGEFTRLIQPQTQPQRPKVPIKQPDPTNGIAEPGEFTRLTTPTAQQAPRGVLRPPGKTPGPPEPGEFTRLIQAKRSAQQTNPSPAEPLNKDTRWELTAVPRQEVAPPQPPVMSGLPEASAPGEFTRMFRQPTSNPTPLLPSEDPFRPDFRSQPSPERPIEQAERAMFDPSGIPRGNKGTEGPSEYTRLFSPPPEFAAQQASSPAPPAADARPSTESGKSSGPSLWVAGGVLAFLALCAIILTVYFALKK